MAATLGADAIYFSLGISVILFIAGVYMKDAALGAISGFVVTFIGLNMIRVGFDGASSVLIQTVGFLLTFIGGYVFLRILFTQMVDEVNEFGGS